MEVIENASLEQKAFTPYQKESIQQLRDRVLPLLAPEQNDDSFLVKWLIGPPVKGLEPWKQLKEWQMEIREIKLRLRSRWHLDVFAQNYDLDQAEDMLKKHIKIFKAYGLDKIEENFKPNEVFDYIYSAMLGYDNEGSVVRIVHLGASDLQGLFLSIPYADCLQYIVYVLSSDASRQKRERINKPMNDKQVFIIDFHGLPWSILLQRSISKRALLILKFYETNFPERLKVAYVVNAPSFFGFIYNWLETIVTESLISKIQVLSQDDCHNQLAKTIDPTILPAAVGGSRRDTDGDPNCPSLYSKPLGTPVPESMIPNNLLEELKNDSEAQKITVDYRSTFSVEIVVKEKNSILQWTFQTLDYDIRMGLRYKRYEDSEPKEIIPTHKVDSHVFPDFGSFTCEDTGICKYKGNDLIEYESNVDLKSKAVEAIQKTKLTGQNIRTIEMF